MNDTYLVQYEPLTTRICRILSLSKYPKPTQDMIEHFYDEVNVTDYYHNTIILTVETDNIDNVRDVIMETFGVLYKS